MSQSVRIAAFFIFLPTYVSELDNFAKFLHFKVRFMTRFCALRQGFCKIYITKTFNFASILRKFCKFLAKYLEMSEICRIFAVSK